MKGDICMKRLGTLFRILAIVLTNVMCGVVGFHYGKMVWGIENAGYSAPASTALLLSIPYLIGIAVCVILAFVFRTEKQTSAEKHKV